ncbi:MAG: hypothetical protein R3B91_15530 [Planctomycetaceae bacterium]
MEGRNTLLAQIHESSFTAPAITDVSGENEYVFIRGNWKKRSEEVPRRFLEVFSGESMCEDANYPDKEQIEIYSHRKHGYKLRFGARQVEISGGGS